MTSHAQDATAQSVIQFWFDESSPKQWFTKDAAFDAAIQTRFGKLLEQAALGEFWGWRSDALGRLAEIIVLDQFSRNVWRDTPKSFAQDPMSLVLTQELIALGLDQGPGVAADDRERIFEPFFRGQLQPQNAARGSGIGLSIVQEYIAAHGGRLYLLPDRPGAHFRIELPHAS